MEEKHFEIPIDLLQKCVRCGLCKSVCPTYRVNEEERSFARGRLALAQMVLSGELPLTKDVARQWDECAMCRRCEWICPNNVEYKEIMSKAKELQSNTLGKDPFKYTALSALELMQTNVGRTVVKMAGSLLSLIPKKELKTYIPSGINGAVKFMPKPAKDAFGIRGQTFKTDKTPSKGTLLFFTGCMVDAFYTTTGKNAIKVLNKAGYDVIVPKDIKCCGAPHLYSGNIEAFNILKAKNQEEISKYNFDAIVVVCPTCGGALLEDYGYKNVLDFASIVASSNDLVLKSKSKESVTFHVPCHSYSAMKTPVSDFENTIKKIENVEYNKASKAQSCCGFAGLFSMKNPELSTAIQKEKMEDFKSTNAEYILSACPGCVLQLQDGNLKFKNNQKIMHIVDFLANKLED